MLIITLIKKLSTIYTFLRINIILLFSLNIYIKITTYSHILYFLIFNLRILNKNIY